MTSRRILLVLTVVALLLLLLAVSARAQVSYPPLLLRDEGVDQGRMTQAINFTGRIVCSWASGVGTCNVPSLASTDLTDSANLPRLNAASNTFAGNVTVSGALTGSLTGNASTATALQTARLIAGVSFNGTANISIQSTGLSDTANLARLDATNTFTNPIKINLGTGITLTDNSGQLIVRDLANTSRAGIQALTGDFSGAVTSAATVAGAHTLRVENTSNNNAAYAQIQFANDTGSAPASGTMRVYSSLYATSGLNIANSFLIAASNAGGLTLSAGNVAGVMRFATAGSERMYLDATGKFGVGTTSPQNLFVVSNAGAAGFEFSPASGSLFTYNRSTAAYTPIVLAGSTLGFSVSGGASVLTIDAGSNVDVPFSAIRTNTAGIVVSSFGNGLNVGSWDSIGYLASPGNMLALGGYRASQWAGVELYAAGSKKATLSATGLGIGMVPAHPLDVATATGTPAVTGYYINSVLYGLNGMSSGASSIISGDSLGDSVFRSDGNDFFFSTDSGSTANVVIKNGGNVGIGATPTRRFHVSATTQNQFIAAQGTALTCTGCGTSPTLTGSDTFFRVTMGASGTPTTPFTVTFSGAWPSAPVCVGNMAKTGMATTKGILTIVTTTTTMVVTLVTNAPATTDIYHFHCGGPTG